MDNCLHNTLRRIEPMPGDPPTMEARYVCKECGDTFNITSEKPIEVCYGTPPANSPTGT